MPSPNVSSAATAKPGERRRPRRVTMRSFVMSCSMRAPYAVYGARPRAADGYARSGGRVVRGTPGPRIGVPSEQEGRAMRILIAYDGSPSADYAIDEVVRRPWPAGTEVRVVTVLEQ